jgi:phospholipase/carboxylesterase
VLNAHAKEPWLRSGAALDAGRPVTILVHGRNRSPEEMLELAARFDLPDMAFVAMSAFGRSWYPEGFMAPLEKNQPHLDHALAALDQLVNELIANNRTRSQIALVGFSQGACLLCEYVYRRGEKFGALVAFTGGLIGPPETKFDCLSDGKRSLEGTPIFLGTSDIDTWVPVARVRETANVFENLGAQVKLAVYPNLEHLVNDEEIAEARPLLAALLA